MRKLSLEDISVESLVMDETTETRGTVNGQWNLALVTDPVSKTCQSNVSWIGDPDICCGI
jgi:hypothetical protein